MHLPKCVLHVKRRPSSSRLLKSAKVYSFKAKKKKAIFRGRRRREREKQGGQG